MKRSSKRTSRSRRDVLDEWSRFLTGFRMGVGFDLTDPVGFSEYLFAVYGRGSDRAVQTLFNSPPFDAAPGQWRQKYDLIFATWARAMSPDGLVCARGLHGLGFLPGDDIAQLIYEGRDAQAALWNTKRRKEDPVSYYSMNVPVAVSQFATRYITKGWPQVSPSWARAAAEIEPDAAEWIGATFREEEHPIYEHGRQVGVRAKMPTRIRRAFHVTQCPVVIVVHAKLADMAGWGGDSESGDTNEAEIHVRHCEPRCVEHVFVASTHKLGVPVNAATRRLYALDEHIEVTGRKDELYGAPKLILHPDVPAPGGRAVRNLPPEWTWYEVPSR